MRRLRPRIGVQGVEARTSEGAEVRGWGGRPQVSGSTERGGSFFPLRTLWMHRARGPGLWLCSGVPSALVKLQGGGNLRPLAQQISEGFARLRAGRCSRRSSCSCGPMWHLHEVSGQVDGGQAQSEAQSFLGTDCTPLSPWGPTGASLFFLLSDPNPWSGLLTPEPLHVLFHLFSPALICLPRASPCCSLSDDVVLSSGQARPAARLLTALHSY